MIVGTNLFAITSAAEGSNISTDEGAGLEPESDGEQAPDHVPLFFADVCLVRDVEVVGGVRISGLATEDLRQGAFVC
jgi:hypothetical protein